MFTDLGLKGAGGVLGGIATLLTLIPWVLVFFGERIRSRSKIAIVSHALSSLVWTYLLIPTCSLFQRNDVFATVGMLRKSSEHLDAFKSLFESVLKAFDAAFLEFIDHCIARILSLRNVDSSSCILSFCFFNPR